jgi:GH15 family glucan-1,4-alpha-glucosidase
MSVRLCCATPADGRAWVLWSPPPDHWTISAAVVDPSFLELVRHGVLRPDDPGIPNTLTVVDQQLGYTTPNGPFWHRASFDGYGETNDGSEWEPTPTGSGLTFGRGWPLLTGERGEYQLAAGSQAQNNLDTMTRSGDDQSFLLPEQVWDFQPPSGSGPAFQPAEPTFSATRSLGRTRSSSGSPGPSTRARRSGRRNRSPAAT